MRLIEKSNSTLLLSLLAVAILRVRVKRGVKMQEGQQLGGEDLDLLKFNYEKSHESIRNINKTAWITIDS
jgi:hypothetical protein